MRELDELGADAFGRALGPLFEGAPRFVARLAADRPFGSYENLLGRAATVAHAMPSDEQRELLDGHPRIGAPPGSVSALSYREQGYDREPGLGATGDHEAARQRLAMELEQLNERYEARHGFRFVIFVAGRSRDEIAHVMEERIAADTDAERRRALDDVVSIARDRLRRFGTPGGRSGAVEAVT
jgi:2-oxo-4-hydroxy-4-carboxy-5-ureidoimidazoline decarboxylase